MTKKILLVDDEPHIVKMLKTRLESEHYDVVTAPDGIPGLAKVESEKPDLILLDIKMPQMDGYTFVKSLQRSEEGKGVPVIMLTAHEQMEELFAMEGVTDYVVKPFKGEELLAKVKKILKKGGGGDVKKNISR